MLWKLNKEIKTSQLFFMALCAERSDGMEVKMEKDKFVGISKVGEKGQIVIPKEARDMFDIKSGDSIIVLCDKQKGIALLKADAIEDLTDKVFPKGGM